MVLRCRQEGHVSCVARQACVLFHAADMYVCCVTQQTCVPWRAAGMSAVSHCRRVHCVTQQTCFLCPTADMPAVTRGDMSAVSHSRPVRLVAQRCTASHSRHVCHVTQLILLKQFLRASASGQEGQSRDQEVHALWIDAGEYQADCPQAK